MADDPTDWREALRRMMVKLPYPAWPEVIGEDDEVPNRSPDDLPDVEHPPWTRPPTHVLGDKAFQDQVEDVMRFQPELRGRVANVQQAPTPSLIEYLLRTNRDPYKFGNADYTNILGMHYPNEEQGSDIFVTPDPRYRENRANTVAHEFGHAGGNQEKWADEVGNLYQHSMGDIDIDALFEALERYEATGTNPEAVFQHLLDQRMMGIPVHQPVKAMDEPPSMNMLMTMKKKQLMKPRSQP